MSHLRHFTHHRFPLLMLLFILTAIGGAQYLAQAKFTAAAAAPAANLYVVTTTADSGPGSLRQAILDNNNYPGGGGLISFNLLTSDPGYQAATGHWSIKPLSALPPINKPVTIDGLTQPGASNATWPPTLKIELDGSSAGEVSGLGIYGGGTVVRGLVINRFKTDGISVLSSGNQIECNYIGTDVTGTEARGNTRAGIVVINANNVIGGVTPDKRNLISGNPGSGITLSLTGASGNQVLGNYIGPDVTGTKSLATASDGILISSGAFNNTIGGTDPGAGNLIAFSAGITVLQGSGGGNAILGNSIHSNSGLGIELSPTYPFDGVTPNDPGDSDAGPNNFQNFPVLAAILADGSISGSLDSDMNNSAYPVRLEFFANTNCDASRSGEGEIYLGSITLSAPGFFLTPAFTIPAGKPFITATATDANGNTSEFSPCAANITVNPKNVADGMTGQSYAPVTFTATNAVGTVNFNLIGALPAGMNFDNNTATLSGTPTQAGDFPFTVEATDQNGNVGSRDYTLHINSLITAAGTVTDKAGGFGIAGVTMTFSLVSGKSTVPAAVTTDASGNWSQTSFTAGATYRVTPTKAGLSFSPASLDFNASNSALNFTAIATSAFTASGLVTNTSGKPLSGVTMTFSVVSGTGKAPGAVVTDANGRWSQSGFSGGTSYRVTPSSKGVSFSPPARDFSSSSSALNFSSGTSFNASGKVTSGKAGGSGLAGVTMTFTIVSGQGTPPAPVVTGKEGQWSQSGFLVGNTYIVTPSNPDYQFTPSTRNFSAASTTLDFTAAPAALSATGKVTDSDGQPMAGVTMTFAATSGKVKTPATVKTDANGVWTATNLISGVTYRVTPSLGSVVFTPSSRTFTAGASGVDFSGATKFSASGQVTDEGGDFGLAGVTLSFFTFSGGKPVPAPIPAVTTDAKGRWSQTGFSVGTMYRVTPSGKGLTFTPKYHNFSTGKDALNFTAESAAAFSASGKVTDGSGQPMSGVTMIFSVIAGGGKAPAAVTTDANGNWVVTNGFRAGITYRVTPSRPGAIFTPASRDFSSSTSALNFTGATTFSGSGQVTDDGGGFGLAGVTMTFSILSGKGVTPAPVITDTSGKWSQSGFSAGVTYRVTPSRKGLSFSPAYLDFSANNTALSFIARASSAFAASGRVTDNNGQPLPGVTMTFARVSGKGTPPAAVTTDANGNWSQSGFSGGAVYRVTPSRPGTIFTPASRDFSSSSTTLNFTASTGFSGSGVVTDVAGFGIAGVTMTFSILSGKGTIPAPVTTDASGKWSQTGFTAGVTYAVTPGSKGLSFSPGRREFSTNSTALNFIAR